MHVHYIVKHMMGLIDNLVVVHRGIISYGALGHVPPQLPTILFLVYFAVNLTANYPIIV